MKTYLSDVIPAIKRQSKKLDDVSVLKNVHWKLVDEESGSRVVYIFRSQNELLISKNGEVEKGRWEYLGNDSLLIEISSKAYLFKQGFYNDYVLGLKKDGVDEYAIMVNEDKVEREITALEELSYIASLLGNSTSMREKPQVENNQLPKEPEDDYDSETEDEIINLIIGIIVIMILILAAMALIP